MGDVVEDRDRVEAYLLGELPDEEQVRMEQDYLTSDSAYEHLLAVEDELAYLYLEGRLPAQRRLRFETTIGATERGRKNLEFARALLDALRTSQRTAAWPARYWMIGVAAALALAILPAWLAVHVASLRMQLENLRAETAASQSRFKRDLASAKIPPAPIEARFLLAPGLARSGEGPARLDLSAQADTLRFELVLPPGAGPGGQYVTAIHASNGEQVWSASAALSGPTLIVQASAKLFSGGDYQIAVRRLTSGEQAPDLAKYSFRLVRQ